MYRILPTFPEYLIEFLEHYTNRNQALIPLSILPFPQQKIPKTIGDRFRDFLRRVLYKNY
jgi:hypothetical protein